MNFLRIVIKSVLNTQQPSVLLTKNIDMAESRNRSNDRRNSNQKNSPDRENEKRKGTKQKDKRQKGSSSMATRENANTREGYGSSQRNDDLNIGPMDGEMDEHPGKSRTSGNNQTGPGLG